MLQKSLTVIFLILLSANAYAELSEEQSDKRERVRYAMKNGILNIYDIPFETYVRLEMWDEIGFIFEANNKNMIRHTFPGMYYSRPYIVRDEVWVFENASGNDSGIHVFDPETLRFLKKLNNRRYERYEGGVRKIWRNTVISGGSDIDVDACVIWDTKTNRVRTVKLQEGHYIGSVEVENGMLYVGSCGGLVNAWNYDTLAYVGKYSSSGKENLNWDVFNEKECITRLKVSGNRLVGVGEKTVFIWDIASRKLLASYEKKMNHAAVSFYKETLVEYKNDKFIVRRLASGEVLGTARAENPVEDLVVTSEKILGKHEGELLILTLRHNKGLRFYDFETLKLIRKMNIHGETLAAYRNAIFATDDRHLYKYDIINKDTGRYETFLKTVPTANIRLDRHTYHQLLRQLHDYPEIIELSGISETFMKMHGLSERHAFKYGKIGERFVSEEGSGEKGYPENVYGYKVLYEVGNHSENYYFVSLAAQWSGEYGKRPAARGEDGWETGGDTNRGIAIQDFFLTPYAERHKDSFEVGEKEPVNLFIYPMRIEKVSKVYYEEFMKTLKGRVDEIAMIDKYLGDDLVKSWHGRLKERRNKLMGEEKGFFWFFDD